MIHLINPYHLIEFWVQIFTTGFPIGNDYHELDVLAICQYVHKLERANTINGHHSKDIGQFWFHFRGRPLGFINSKSCAPGPAAKEVQLLGAAGKQPLFCTTGMDTNQSGPFCSQRWIHNLYNHQELGCNLQQFGFNQLKEQGDMGTSAPGHCQYQETLIRERSTNN